MNKSCTTRRRRGAGRARRRAGAGARPAAPARRRSRRCRRCRSTSRAATCSSRSGCTTTRRARSTCASSANGEDVSGSFRTMPDGSLRGLVDGLGLGPNEIVARANGQGKGTPPGRSATLRGRQPPARRAAVLGPAAGAVLLRDRAERPRAGARRRLLRADAGALPLPHDRRHVRRARRPDRRSRPTSPRRRRSTAAPSTTSFGSRRA